MPDVLAEPLAGSDASVERLRDAICDLLWHYWELAIEPYWPQIRLLIEADMTYRARRLVQGGARLLFADLHPNLLWRNGTLRIDKMIGHHRVAAAGRGLLLVPSLFAYKPVPLLDPTEPPWLAYPCRGGGDVVGGAASGRRVRAGVAARPAPHRPVETARRAVAHGGDRPPVAGDAERRLPAPAGAACDRLGQPDPGRAGGTCSTGAVRSATTCSALLDHQGPVRSKAARSASDSVTDAESGAGNWAGRRTCSPCQSSTWNPTVKIWYVWPFAADLR